MTSQECRFLTEQSITRVATIGYFLFRESTIYCEVSSGGYSKLGARGEIQIRGPQNDVTMTSGGYSNLGA